MWVAAQQFVRGYIQLCGLFVCLPLTLKRRYIYEQLPDQQGERVGLSGHVDALVPQHSSSVLQRNNSIIDVRD